MPIERRDGSAVPQSCYELNLSIRENILTSVATLMKNQLENDSASLGRCVFFLKFKVKELRDPRSELLIDFMRDLLGKLEIPEFEFIFMMTCSEAEVQLFRLTVFEMTPTLGNGVSREIQCDILRCISNVMKREMKRLSLNDEIQIKEIKQSDAETRDPFYGEIFCRTSAIEVEDIILDFNDNIYDVLCMVRDLGIQILKALRDPLLRVECAASADRRTVRFRAISCWDIEQGLLG